MTLSKKHISKYKKIICVASALLLVLFMGNILSAQAQYARKSADAAYTAEINEINPTLTEGEVSGQAWFIVDEGQLQITIMVKGLAPSMMHLQHIHGFKELNKKSSCPASGADTNGDGIVDLIETQPSSGITLIPFNADPTELKIKSSSYPVANEEGLSTYQMNVSLDALESAIQNKYDINKLSLEDRVIFIHGVPKEKTLPQTVQSLPDVPAHVTVPLACGEIESL